MAARNWCLMSEGHQHTGQSYTWFSKWIIFSQFNHLKSAVELEIVVIVFFYLLTSFFVHANKLFLSYWCTKNFSLLTHGSFYSVFFGFLPLLFRDFRSVPLLHPPPIIIGHIDNDVCFIIIRSMTQAYSKKNLNYPNSSRTYDLPAATPDALLLSYRTLVEPSPLK